MKNCKKAGANGLRGTPLPTIALSFVFIFCFVGCVTGSCLSYGHSCWGAHGKRSGSGSSSNSGDDSHSDNTVDNKNNKNNNYMYEALAFGDNRIQKDDLDSKLIGSTLLSDQWFLPRLIATSRRMQIPLSSDKYHTRRYDNSHGKFRNSRYDYWNRNGGKLTVDDILAGQGNFKDNGDLSEGIFEEKRKNVKNDEEPEEDLVDAEILTSNMNQDPNQESNPRIVRLIKILSNKVDEKSRK